MLTACTLRLCPETNSDIYMMSSLIGQDSGVYRRLFLSARTGHPAGTDVQAMRCQCQTVLGML